MTMRVTVKVWSERHKVTRAPIDKPLEAGFNYGGGRRTWPGEQ
jgi:hypothetical protein